MVEETSFFADPDQASEAKVGEGMERMEIQERQRQVFHLACNVDFGALALSESPPVGKGAVEFHLATVRLLHGCLHWIPKASFLVV